VLTLNKNNSKKNRRREKERDCCYASQLFMSGI